MLKSLSLDKVPLPVRQVGRLVFSDSTPLLVRWLVSIVFLTLFIRTVHLIHGPIPTPEADPRVRRILDNIIKDAKCSYVNHNTDSSKTLIRENEFKTGRPLNPIGNTEKPDDNHRVPVINVKSHEILKPEKPNIIVEKSKDAAPKVNSVNGKSENPAQSDITAVHTSNNSVGTVVPPVHKAKDITKIIEAPGPKSTKPNKKVEDRAHMSEKVKTPTAMSQDVVTKSGSSLTS